MAFNNIYNPVGQQGISGYSGYSSFSGYSGISGYSSFSGYSGISGFTGISGYSGISGFTGISGYSGISGYTGISGYSGVSGYSGLSVPNLQTVTYANAFSAGQVIYKTSGGYGLAQANAAATADAIGIVQSSTGTTFTYVINGYISGLTGLTDSYHYYLSDSVAGQLTNTPPTAAGSIIKPMLIAIGSTAGIVVEYAGSQIGTNAGTSGYYAKWTSANTLGNGITQDDGTNVTVSGNLSASGNISGNNLNINTASYGFSPSNTASANTTALQNAVNAATAVNGTVIIPAGKYNINAAITIGTSASPYNGKIRIQGSGKNTTEIVQTSATDGIVCYLVSPGPNDIGFELTDLSLISSNSSAGTAVYLNITPYASIENRDLFYINNVAATGVVTSNTGGWTNGFWVVAGWHGIISNCYAGGCINTMPINSTGAGSGAGFLMQDCINCKLSNVTAEFFAKGISSPNNYVPWVSGSNYTAGQYVKVGPYTYFVCILSIINSTTSPGSDPTHFMSTDGPSQGLQVNNYMSLDTTYGIYYNTTTPYITNFLIDNGNNYANWTSIFVANTYAAGYITSGQILQYGGSNQIALSGCTGGVIMNSIDFTQQNGLSGASILLTNNTAASVTTSCLFGSASAIQCDSGSNYNKAAVNVCNGLATPKYLNNGANNSFT